MIVAPGANESFFFLWVGTDGLAADGTAAHASEYTGLLHTSGFSDNSHVIYVMMYITVCVSDQTDQ